jgi:hypothetical protein
MSDFVPNFTKTYQIISASCKVLAKIDWSGNYIIDKISDEELQFLGEAKTPEQYFKRFIEIVKERVLKKLSDINYVKWHVKGFDETISLHYFTREVSKILEKYIKLELTKKYPQFVHHINNHKIDFNKTLIVEITNNDKTIFIANINVEHFI